MLISERSGSGPTHPDVTIYTTDIGFPYCKLGTSDKLLQI